MRKFFSGMKFSKIVSAELTVITGKFTARFKVAQFFWLPMMQKFTD